VTVHRGAIALGLALAGAAGLVGCTQPVVTPRQTATPTPAVPSSAASSTPAPVVGLVFPPPGRVTAGSHTVTVEGISFTFEASNDAWVADRGATWAKLDLDRVAPIDGLPDGAAVLFWSPDGAYLDPCDHIRGEPVDSTPAAFAAAISAVPGVMVKGGLTTTTLGGLPAIRVELVVPAEASCAAEDLYLWYDTVEAWRWATALGDQIRIWIVEVDGARLVVEAETRKAPSSATATEVQDLVDSIRFE
jgi:hypothetical protein